MNRQMDIWPELHEDEEDMQIEEYELTSSPNDFNILTIFSFIESGAVKIPGFQRNYVWDIKRASKLIESIIIGLPIPQIFLYEENRNKFLVIDGQQRLMTIYYFIKQRFPKKNKRASLRRTFSELGKIPDDVLYNDEYFEKFNLKLPEISSHKSNKFNNLNYNSLLDYKTQFDLRTIRNVIVKQNAPKEDDSSIYEMFNRLNTGGINLTSQEIRSSLYHSTFYDMLYRINLLDNWRRFLGNEEPDLHMRDIEMLLRSFAMLHESETYSSSMAKFLNRFSKTAKSFSIQKVNYLEQLFMVFLTNSEDVSDNAFLTKTGKFSITLFETVFTAVCSNALLDNNFELIKLNNNILDSLKQDNTMQEYSQAQSTNKANVTGRINRAKDLIITT